MCGCCIFRTSSGRNPDTEYTVVMGSVPLEDSPQGLVFGVAVASVKVPEMVTIKSSE